MRNKKAKRRVLVTFDEEQIELLEQIKGMGDKIAEKVRNIVIAYLSEKSYIKELNMKRWKR